MHDRGNHQADCPVDNHFRLDGSRYQQKTSECLCRVGSEAILGFGAQLHAGASRERVDTVGEAGLASNNAKIMPGEALDYFGEYLLNKR